MTDERPDRPPARGLVDALDIRRNVAIGLVVGLLVGALAVFYRVVLIGTTPGRAVPLSFFVALGFVLVVSLAALVTVVLTAIRAWRVARTIDADENG